MHVGCIRLYTHIHAYYLAAVIGEHPFGVSLCACIVVFMSVCQHHSEDWAGLGGKGGQLWLWCGG